MAFDNKRKEWLEEQEKLKSQLSQLVVESKIVKESKRKIKRPPNAEEHVLDENKKKINSGLTLNDRERFNERFGDSVTTLKSEAPVEEQESVAELSYELSEAPVHESKMEADIATGEPSGEPLEELSGELSQEPPTSKIEEESPSTPPIERKPVIKTLMPKKILRPKLVKLQPKLPQEEISTPPEQEPEVEEPEGQEPEVEEPEGQEPEGQVQEPKMQELEVEEPEVQVQEPGIKIPTIQQPMVQQPTVQQPMVQQPTVQQPMVQQPTVQQPTAQQTKPQISTTPLDKEEIQKITQQITTALEIIQKTPDYINFQNANDLITQARNALAINRIDEAKALAEQGGNIVNSIYQQFIKALQALKDVKDKIIQAKSNGVDVSIAIKIFQQAKNTLKNNDFNNAIIYSNLCEKQLVKK